MTEEQKSLAAGAFCALWTGRKGFLVLARITPEGFYYTGFGVFDSGTQTKFRSWDEDTIEGWLRLAAMARRAA